MSPDRYESQLASRLEAIATRWSLIRDAHAGGAPLNVTAARQALVLRYAKSIRRYVGGIVKKADDADELAQDVVMRLMKGDFGGADPNRGRFRDLLKAAVRNMVHNHWAKANRRKTADADLGLVGKEDADDLAWTAEWQANVLDLAWSALKEFERKNPANPAHTLLKLRTEFPDATSDELAEKLSQKTKTTVRADACRQMLRRARLRFAEAVVTEVGVGLADPSPARVADELAALGLLEYVRDFLPDDWAATGSLKE
jgi:DNA-directed RNA polymerase specialized sigma24 family protein